MQTRIVFRTSAASNNQQYRGIKVTEAQWATIMAAEEIVRSFNTDERRFFYSGITKDEWYRIMEQIEEIIEREEVAHLTGEQYPLNCFSSMQLAILSKIAKECGREIGRLMEPVDMKQIKSEELQLAMREIKGIKKNDDCMFISDIRRFIIKVIWEEVDKELQQDLKYEAESDQATSEWADKMRANDVEMEQDPDRWEQGFDSAEFDPSTGFPVWYKDNEGREPEDEK